MANMTQAGQLYTVDSPAHDSETDSVRTHQYAILIDFDNPEECRQAMMSGRCEFMSFREQMGLDKKETPLETRYAKCEDEETWSLENWRDTAQELADNSHPEELTVGSVLTIYEGTITPRPVLSLVSGEGHTLAENLREQIYEIGGECAAENFLDSDKLEKKFDNDLSAFLERWSKENGDALEINTIEDIGPIDVEITANDGQGNIVFKRTDGKD